MPMVGCIPHISHSALVYGKEAVPSKNLRNGEQEVSYNAKPSQFLPMIEGILSSFFCYIFPDFDYFELLLSQTNMCFLYLVENNDGL